MANLNVSELKTPRTFAGEATAKKLIDWLNAQGETAEYKRITGLLKDLSELFLSEGENPGFLAFPTWLGPRFDELIPRLLSEKGKPIGTSKQAVLVGRINTRLRRYKVWPCLGFVHPGESMTFMWQPIRGGRMHVIIGDLVQVAAQGYIAKVRQCDECNKWYYARFFDQRFCTGGCRQKTYLASEPTKVRRREYMRNYMRRRLARQKGGK